jgi:polysaccharide biosynthesis/export protein
MPDRINKLHICFLLFIVSMLFPFSAKCDQLDKDYIIGPGDVLEIRVWDHDDLFRRVEVSQEGAITYPFIGRIMAANHSVFELETLLQKKLADGYLVAPQVNVTVAEYINQKIFLFGEVNKPGSYTLRKKIHLLELISEAGGFTENRGTKCIIVRPRSAKAKQGPTSPEQVSKNETIEVNLDDLIAGRLNLNQAYVKPGDSVYVKEAENVYVIGQVDKPGKYKWVKGLTVLQTISLAGGGTPRAAMNRVSIIRRQNGAEKEYRPELGEGVQPNDIIKVPESYF